MPAIDADARSLVSPEDLTATVKYLCSLGEKVSGSAEEEKACAYLVERLKSYGYEPVVHVFDSYVSYPRATALTVQGRERYELPVVGVAFGLSTPPEGVTAEIVFAGAGDKAGFAGKDVRGKIALVTKLPSPNNALEAANAGALGMICMSAGKQRHKMIITPVWGTPEFDQTKKIPRLHVVSISAVDGKRIEEDLKKGPVKATLVCDVFEGWRKVRLPTVEIKGKEPLFSLVGAHYCSWFDGSTDNVTGDACVLELARVLKQFDGKLRYGLRFCWWPGHSHGRYSGSTWYADTYWRDLRDNAIVYFNIDSPGVKGATVYVPRHQMAEVSEFNEAMTKEITGWSTITSAKAQLALGKRGDKYVSAHETFDKYDPEILAQDTRLYASILARMATAEVLPFNLAMIAQDYLDSLREFDESAGDALPFKELIASVKALQEKLKALHAHCAALTGDARTHAANQVFLRIARALNPVLYQVCGPFEHDPALGSRALPSLGPALTLSAMEKESDAYRFTIVGVRRRMNHVANQIEEAVRLADEFMRG